MFSGLPADKPDCKIKQSEDDGRILLTCVADANPADVSFVWKVGNETTRRDISEAEDGDFFIERGSLTSTLSLEATPDSFGTYFCYVNNSMGRGSPCEIDLTSKGTSNCGNKKIPIFGLSPGIGHLELSSANVIVIVTVSAAAIVLVLLVCVVVILFCRMRKPKEKCERFLEGLSYPWCAHPECVYTVVSASFSGSSRFSL